MLLVPRQLRRAGMTGNVPYYGGRLTPAATLPDSKTIRVYAQDSARKDRVRRV